MAISQFFKQSPSVFRFYSCGFAFFLVLFICNNGCLAAGSLDGKEEYLGIPGKRLVLTWRYTGASMYRQVTILVPGQAMSDFLLLWALKYDPTTNTSKTEKRNVSKSIFNNITEFHSTRNVFTLVIKSVPSSVSSFKILCRVRWPNLFDKLDNTSNVKVAVSPSVEIAVKKGSNVHVAKGRKVEITCSATGTPMPSIQLKKNGIIRKEGRSTKTISYTISQIQPRDAGTYVCEAKNVVGFAVKDDVITVRYLEAKAKPFVVTFAKFGKLQVKCPVEGYPRVIYSWFHGKTEKLTAARVLDVKLQKKEDFGNYTCRGLNDVGELEVVFSVRKKPVPSKRGSSGDNLKIQRNLAAFVLIVTLWNWMHFSFLEQLLSNLSLK